MFNKEYRSHYEWLEKNLPEFLKRVGVKWSCCCGIISAHGDKFYSQKELFKRFGLPFEHGVAIGLLTYLRPWEDECRTTKNGWVSLDTWIENNYKRFVEFLPPPREPHQLILRIGEKEED
jgi:hypothetical protein